MTDALTPPATDDASAVIPGERTISPIAGRFGFGKTGKAIAVAALAAACGVFLLATGRHPPAKAAEPQAPARQVVPFEPATAAAPPTLAHPGAAAPTLTADGSSGGAPPHAAGPPPGAAGAAQGPAGTSPAQRGASSLSAPILAFSRGGGETAAPTAPYVPALLPRGAAGEASELDPLRRGSTLGMARATRLPDRSYLILAGTSIPCVLQTAMDTSTPGFVSCLVPTDVYSDNGAVVLLEKGTKVLGEYHGGPKQGLNRLFVLWTRAVTPAGVAISLASPAADALGRAGFGGDVDSHFWDRFGGAILLSVIDGGLSAAARGAADVNVQVPSNAANTALQSAINIPPTLRKSAGAEVSIFAAQDFDFSGVYGVKAR